MLRIVSLTISLIISMTHVAQSQEVGFKTLQIEKYIAWVDLIEICDPHPGVCFGRDLGVRFQFFQSDYELRTPLFGDTNVLVVEHIDGNPVREYEGYLEMLPFKVDRYNVQLGYINPETTNWELIGNPNQSYQKLKDGLDTKYGLDWAFDQDDIEALNSGEIDRLWTSFGNGRVWIEVWRTVLGYDLRVWYHNNVNYRMYSDIRRAEQNKRKPKLSNSDF